MIVLPTEKVKAKINNPRFLIIYGRPKAGKTSCVAALDNNLIIDLEGGSEFLDCLSIQARSVSDLADIANAIRSKMKEVNGYPYKYITLDNATRLEEICLSYAATLYKQQPQGKSWQGTDIRLLPQGAGYQYIRLAVRKVIDMFKELTENLILIGHTKDKLINKNGQDITEMSLDLVGKLGDIICGEADAVGFMYRKGNQTVVNFNSGDDTTKGARAPHLREQRIVLAESDDNNNLTFHWDKIYLPEK